jgi:hypothetical protein
MNFMGLANGIDYNMIVEYAKILELDKVGHFSGLDTEILDDKKKDEICRVILSAIILHHPIKGLHESVLSIRELVPSLDLTDSDSNPASNEWKQTHSPKKSGSTVYRINNRSVISYKLMCIYAIKIPEDHNVDEIQIWKSEISLIDRLYLSGHDPGVTMLNSPILIGINGHNNYHIDFKFTNNEDNRTSSNIKICGYVCEPLGVTTYPYG